MGKKLEEIKVINVDNVPYDVTSCSTQVQALVEYYNEWRQKEFDLKREVVMIEAAQRELSREIIETIRREQEDKEDDVAQNTTPAADTAAANDPAAPAPSDEE